MNIRIVGGGWYGCHIALKLAGRGHRVNLFEAGPWLFCGASGNNQSRLHLGFHYPRDAVTRVRALEESTRFLAEYCDFTRAVRTNVYAVAEEVSLLDYETYRTVMTASGAQFVDLQPGDYGVRNVQGAMLTGERLILEDDAARWFALQFSHNENVTQVFDCRIADLRVDAPGYDWTIDCTFGAFDIHDVEWYEPCCLALYTALGCPQDNFALTVMDGPEGVSLYPYHRNELASLTSVAETPLRRCDSMDGARETIRQFLENDVWQERIREQMEDKILRYYPRFRELYTRSKTSDDDWACAVRVKPISGSDRRAIIVTPRPEERIVTVFPGKITGIFDAWEQVREVLGC